MIWWTKSWNPVIGCTKCSPACDNCYAERLHTQRHQALLAGKKMPDCYRRPFDMPCFVTARINEPLHWRKPQRIFVGNMGDLFHENFAFEWLDFIFGTMAACQQHTFMLLTKRPERMAAYIQDLSGRYGPVWPHPLTGKRKPCFPLPNVWLGTTIWDQASADRAVPILLSTPAAKRFVSVEPMLGPVSLAKAYRYLGGDWLYPLQPQSAREKIQADGPPSDPQGWPSLDWVICGGETGPGARPMHPDWPCKLRDDCEAAGVPFFFKQWGEWGPTHVNGHGPVWWSFENYSHYCAKAHTHMSKGDKLICPDGHIPTDGREDGKSYPMYPTRRVGKAKAGRVLDGRTWEEVPNAR
ncbi:phage Gp37/Gp68 family protein [Humidesulfovibrio idahonensis]